MNGYRGELHDRAVTRVWNTGQAIAIAAGTATAAIYTVPAGRRAILHLVFLRTRWSAAPVAGDRAQGEVRGLVGGVTIREILGVQPASDDVDTEGYATTAAGILLLAADAVEVFADATDSAAGISAVGTCFLTEFDD